MDTRITVRDGNLALVLDAIATDPALADSTKTQYRRALEGYAAGGGSLTDPHALAAYARGVSVSTAAFLAAGVGKLAERIAHEARGQATPANVATVQAAIFRAQALKDAIRVATPKGRKAHTWLTKCELQALLDTCGGDIEGQRDRLALGLLVGAGLRREEAVTLRFEDVVLQPVKGKLREVLTIVGKGKKARSVPISDRLAGALDAWSAVTGGGGRVLRSLGRNRVLGSSISAVAVFHIVRKRGAMIGKPTLAPHDLRRTYAQLGYEAGVPVTQISRLLGHASITTTQRYLNLELDLATTVSDFVPF